MSSSLSMETVESGTSMDAGSKKAGPQPEYNETLKINPDKMTPQMKALVDEFDVDGDGEIDLYELLNAMQVLHSARKSNKQMMRAVFGMIVLVAFALTAIFAVCVGAVAVIKDTKVKKDSDAAVMRSKSGLEDVQSIVRTAPVDPATQVGAQISTPAGSAAADAPAEPIDTSLVKYTYALTVCETEALSSSAGFLFANTFAFAETKGISMTMKDTQLPLSIEVAQPDGSITILHTRAVGKSVVDLAARFPDGVGSVVVLDLEFMSNASRRARVCCLDGLCYYGAGERTEVSVCTVANDAGDLECLSSTINTGARHEAHAAGTMKRTPKHFYRGLNPHKDIATIETASKVRMGKGQPLIDLPMVEVPKAEFRVPLADVMEVGAPWVCRNGDANVYAAKRTGSSFSWVTLQAATQTGPNAHLLFTPGSDFANLATGLSFLRTKMNTANPICRDPTVNFPVLEYYVVGADVFYVEGGVKTTFNMGTWENNWLASFNGHGNYATSTSYQDFEVNYPLPVAICACRPNPTATSASVGFGARENKNAFTGSFRV